MKTSPVKQLALQHSLPHQDVPATGMLDFTAPKHLLHNPKAILLTCSFGHLIPDPLLDAFPNPWQRINIHPSLLPQLRGAAPIQWALARRLSTSGVSIQTLEKGRFDTGKIVAQQAFDFPPPCSGTPSFLEVEKVMADRAASLLVSTLSDLPQCWRYSWEQDERMKSYAPKLKAEHSVVRWDRWSARDIVAREGAFAYLYPLSTNLVPPNGANFRPVTITLSNTSAVAVEDLRRVDPMLASVLKQNAVPPGSAIFSVDANMLIVKTTSDAEVLGVGNVKVAGKKGKDAKDWWRAYRDRADGRSGLLLFQ
ncbi:Methionyl-tRNA formyltransferase, mitochondrial [Pseudozyma hubeiensis]|nr:Methionyl-tRNA formyltransferase, mitochondrial [Pseudozyma hubeiensis]